jgi:hypothetical protein
MGHPPPRGIGESELTIVIVDLSRLIEEMFGGFTTTERNRASSHERDEQQPRTNQCKRAGAVVRSKNKQVELDSADFLRDVID